VSVAESPRGWSVMIRLENVSAKEGEAVALRWWTFAGARGEKAAALAENCAEEACEGTKVAGNAFVSPFTRSDSGAYSLELVLPRRGGGGMSADMADDIAHLAFNPTYVHRREAKPVLSSPSGSLQSFFAVPLGCLSSGTPFPLGAHRQGTWVNLALVSPATSPPKVCFWESTGARDGASFKLELDSTVNRTGDVWHCAVRVPPNITAYAFCLSEVDPANGYKLGERITPDPFGDDMTEVRLQEGEAGSESFRPIFVSLLPPPSAESGTWGAEGEGEDDPEWLSTWEADGPLEHMLSKAVILEMDLRKEAGDGIEAGDIDGEAAGIDIFEAVESAAMEFEDSGVTALAVRGLLNEDTLTGVTPSQSGALGSTEIKRLVSRLHQMDLELILEVDCLKLLSATRAAHLNEGPAVQALKESLRFLVSEYHLDGFCFLHAEKLTHGEFDTVLDRPRVVEDLCSDPTLQSTKLIAVPFGNHLLPREGLRGFPHWGKWMELNSRFTEDMQALYEGGSEVDLTRVSMRLTGSADLFQQWENGSFHLFAERSPCHGLNSASFAFGRSGGGLLQGTPADDGIRWSLLSAVFLSQGVPFVRLLDLSDRDWVQEVALLTKMCQFREQFFHLIQKSSFRDPRDLRWHSIDHTVEPPWPGAGLEPTVVEVEMSPESVEIPVVPLGGGVPAQARAPPGGGPLGSEAGGGGGGAPSDASNFIGMSVWSASGMEAIYAAFNGNGSSVEATIPQAQVGCKWFLLLDSGRMEACLSNERVEVSQQYLMQPKSSIVLGMQLENIDPQQ